MERKVWLALVVCVSACTKDGTTLSGVSSFHVEVTAVNAKPPPTLDAPLPANTGDTLDTWDFTIEARTPAGKAQPFNGMVRLSVRPGAVLRVDGDGAIARNIRLTGGKATGKVTVTGVYGPTRLWVEDVGYLPGPLGKKAQCENGKNDDKDGDVLVDYPNDPGCAFADDDSEAEGTYAAGISGPVHYALPRLSDIQGHGSETPYPFEGMEVKVADPQHVIVTRVSSDGFYITDIAPDEMTGGYNHLFAFNFNTPPGMRICDRVTYLAGTVNEFFGFTELSFPSYRLSYPVEGQGECEIPEPTVIRGNVLVDEVAMEKLESGSVRIEGFHVPSKFGPKAVVNNVPDADHSSCDLNGDGQVDFQSPDEGGCSDVCSQDPECSEWTTFSARGNYKGYFKECINEPKPCMTAADCSMGATTDSCTMNLCAVETISKPCELDTDCTSSCGIAGLIQVQTGAISDFDPPSHKGERLKAVTGTMRNFSGGSLNWTIETRCPDDLSCDGAGCVPDPLSSKTACVRLRTQDDNDQGTN